MHHAIIILVAYNTDAIIIMCTYTHSEHTGVGSMGAPGAGAPMKFLSGTQCHTSPLFY